ncbi:hypothetical protein Q7P36_004256 [Cladosporium allicinum]
MGLSAFWTAIKRPRFSDSSDSRKHVDRVQDRRHTPAPVRPTPNEASRHLDPIYDAHHHIVPGQSQGLSRQPSSPPRIHSPIDTKQNRKSSIWRSGSQHVKPSQSSDTVKTLKTEKSMKRRSFWQSEPKPTTTAPQSEPKITTTAPPVRKPEPVSPSSRNAEVKKAKRNSYWRPEASFEPERLLSESNADATDMKTKRSSRRLSLHRNPSSKSSRSRNSLRFSFLAGGADDSDDDDIPAMPPIPVNLQRQKSRSKDPGRGLGVGGPQPGTAITSDDTSPTKRKSMNRRSLSKLMTNRKSTSDIQQDDPSGNNKRKRRSWFSAHGSDSSPDTAVPPMPALPNNSANLTFPANLDPAEAAFHRFLHNVHNAAPKGAVATDFERFLDASRTFDASAPTPPHLSHRNSTTEMHSPRPAAFLPGLQKRSTIAVQPKSRASHCRPARLNTTNLAGRTLSDSESPGEQREWSKLRHTMNDSASPDTSGEWNRESDEDDDGVMGMLRELSRDERYEAHHRAEKRRRDRETYLGIGTFENKDALAALEFGASRG